NLLLGGNGNAADTGSGISYLFYLAEKDSEKRGIIMEIIIATGNAGKVREFKRMLEPLGYTVFSQKEKEITVDAEENGDTFAENALIKARAVWEVAHTAVIADDSGR